MYARKAAVSTLEFALPTGLIEAFSSVTHPSPSVTQKAKNLRIVILPSIEEERNPPSIRHPIRHHPSPNTPTSSH